MRCGLFGLMVVFGLLIAACDQAKDPKEGLTFAHPTDQRQFTDALAKAGIAYSLEVKEGRKFVVWSQRDRDSVSRIQASLVVPPGRNLSLTPAENQAEFKTWLSENGIPFTTRLSLGQEYVVWAEQDTERVKKWPKWTEPPAK